MIGLMLINSLVLLAQQLPTIPSYSFLNLSKNYIYQPDTSALSNFYNQLDSLANGFSNQVKILHIGDSHIQADQFTGQVRNLFFDESMFANSSRGFLFPYPLAKTNSSHTYTVSYTGTWTGCRNISKDKLCSWGLAGVVATTQTPNATFTLRLNTNVTSFNSVKIFYPLQDKTQFEVKYVGNFDDLIAEEIDTAHGCKTFLLSKGMTEITFSLHSTDTLQNQFVMQGILLENDEEGIHYSSLGVNGAKVPDFLRSPDLAKHLKAYEPNLVIISLGTNDAYSTGFQEDTFRIQFGQLIQRIKWAVPNTSILLTTPGDAYRSYRYLNPNNIKAKDQIFRIAEETNSAVWDFFTVMGGFRSVHKWYINGLAQKDKLHLTYKGYKLQGDLFYTALMNGYHEHLSKKKDYPLSKAKP
jgi:lysophospholipase L1-like esterase